MEDGELESFKRDIDLRQYAASLGYEINRAESWRGSSVMRCGGDKIVVKRNSNGHFVYFSVRDDADNGSIIDFLQRRGGGSLGHVRRALREWTGKAPSSPLPLFPKLEPASRDRLKVETEYRRMQDAPSHPYLLERGIPAGVLASGRFAGRVQIDGRGNAVFPHFDQDGLCGYEIKNRTFTGFASGGEKGLWVSRTKPEDVRMVLAESAIDALSYAALFPDKDDRARYGSIGGKPNPKQPSLLKTAFGKLPAGSVIVAAFDADDAGRELAELVRALVADDGRLKFHPALPPINGRDWNDVLRSRESSFPIARFGL